MTLTFSEIIDAINDLALQTGREPEDIATDILEWFMNEEELEMVNSIMGETPAARQQ